MPANQPAQTDRGRPYARAFDLYWSAGWRGVIPVRGKYPPPDGYTGAIGQWPSYPDCYAWSETLGAQNIALRMPEQIIGLDVDNYDGKTGGATLFDCQMLWGELPITYRSTARDDGISGIRLFRIPTGLSWPGQLPGGGVELIRWDHRYCMCWPSVHPKTLGVYRWFDPNGAILINVVPSPDALPALPSRWIEGLTRGAWRHDDKADLKSAALQAFLFGLSGAEEEPCPRIRFAAQRLSELIRTSDSRHDIARDGVLNLARLAEEGHPGVINVLQTVCEAFVLAVTGDGTRSANVASGEFVRFVDGALRIVANGARTPSIGDPCIVPSDPPYRPGEPLNERGRRITHAEPQSAVTDALRADKGQAQASAPVGDEALRALVEQRKLWRRADRMAREELEAEDAPEVDDELGMTLTGLVSESRPQAEYLIDKVLPVNARILLAAQNKAGKTTLIGNLIRSVCDQTPFLGYGVTLPGSSRIGLLDFEMDKDTLARWLRDMRIENMDRAYVWSMLGRVSQFDIRNPSVFGKWVDKIRAQQITTLVIDCLKPILDQLGLDEHHDTGKITTPLSALRTEAGIRELILVHHMGHNGERSRGDSALRGWPEVEWMLVRLSADPDKEAALDAPRFFKAYGRDVNIPECELGYDSKTRILSIAGSQNRQDARAALEQGKLETAILACVQSEPGIARGKVPGWLREQGFKIKTATVVAAINALLQRQALRERLGGPTKSTHELYPEIRPNGVVIPTHSLIPE